MGKFIGKILIVEDNINNQILLERRLRKQGYQVECAGNGSDALDILQTQLFDVILLDVMMPHMTGFELLEKLKSHTTLRQIPVVMISALNSQDNVIRGIELGAEDYMFKPFKPSLLQARLDALLEKRRWQEQEKAYLKALEEEKRKSDQLLLNVMPKPIAERLKQGEQNIADYMPAVTVLFGDLVGFTNLSSHVSPYTLVGILNDIFSDFDRLTEEFGLEKVKTVGDGYMVAGGMLQNCLDHAEKMIWLALAMQKAIRKCRHSAQYALQMRIGIHTGAVVAGVIGTHKFSYDLWGDTVNIASRLQQFGQAGSIQISETTYQLVKEKFSFKKGQQDLKGKGNTTVYLLDTPSNHP